MAAAVGEGQERLADGNGALLRGELLQAVARGRLAYPLRATPVDGGPLADGGDGGWAGLACEALVLHTEDGPQGAVPVWLVRRQESAGVALPVALLLHATGRSKEAMAPYLQAYARAGFLAVAIDSRYHGGRAQTPDAYAQALVRAWREGHEHPFLYDTAYDVVRLLDYLVTRPDVDASRIGAMGISLGGMHAWLAAAADERLSAVASIIGVQSFRFAVDHDQWQARVASIPNVFAAAAADLGKPHVDGHVVRCVWDRIVPGLLGRFDAEWSLPALAPRPFLVISGETDPRCPIEGLRPAIAAAAAAYARLHRDDAFRWEIVPGVGHEMVDDMARLAEGWLCRHLL